MGRIQSTVGLITGVPIADTVSKLMQLAARPRDMLVERTEALKQEQVVVTELAAKLLAVKYTAENLTRDELYEQRQATSSNPAALSATVTGTPPKGDYLFTPLRSVQSHQLISSGFASSTDPIGAGTLTLRFGSHVQRSVPMELLNEGRGFTRGRILITDRSGARAEIDLSGAQTLDDVLQAINDNRTINVTAVAQGDHLRLIDNTGQTVSNLIVQEVGGGTTAASLGLAGINVGASAADGQDILRLYEDLELRHLNDGNGVVFQTALPDIGFTLRDGTAGNIDFSPIMPGSSEVDHELTLGDVIERINAASPGKLQAELSPDGKRLVLRDLTAGDGEFTLFPLYESDALQDLGLDRPAQDGVIEGRRLLGGLKSVLLSSLNGGNGLGALGKIDLTDRSGAEATVDLSAAETLDDVIQAINGAGIGILARVNPARNGIELLDTTGSTAGNLIVADADANNTASKLGIAINDAVNSVNGGDLHLQIISPNTLLSELNGGRGVARGTLLIEDSLGNREVLDLRDPKIQTVGDVLKAIYGMRVRVYAEINETGDGILLRDLENGPGELAVYEGESTTARDLGIFRLSEQRVVDGELTQVIDGSMTYRVEIDEDDRLGDLQQKINQLQMGVVVTRLNDGSALPYRLMFSSQQPGKAGQLVVDTSQAGFSVIETTAAQDALLAFGDLRNSSASILVSSSTNEFRSVLPGVTLTLQQATAQPVVVSVSDTQTDLVDGVKDLVEKYNKFRERLLELTAYDPETDDRSLLTGDATALRLDSELSYLLSSRFAGTGSIHSLAELGLSLNDDGTLKFDEEKFQAVLDEDPEAVRRFFTEEETGFAARLGKLIDQMTEEDVSLLAQRYKALRSKIQENERKIEAMNEQLQREQRRLYMEFYRMEVAIGKLQANLNALAAITPLPPLSLGGGGGSEGE